jgi:hypothetical protein
MFWRRTLLVAINQLRPSWENSLIEHQVSYSILVIQVLALEHLLFKK